MARSNAHRRAELDARLGRAKVLIPDERPARGWVRAIRDALGMSSTELAARMGVTQSWIPAMERNEVDGSIRLDTLRRAADALDCEVVYALVPRTSLDEAVARQAEEQEWESTGPALRRLRAEQRPIPASVVELVEARSQRRIDHRGLWVDRPPKPISIREWDIDAALAGSAPPTADDVSITYDGRRLDTAAKVRAFLAELDAERAEHA